MATLHDQPPRQQTLGRYYGDIWGWIQKYIGATDPAAVTPEQWQAAAAVVRTALAIQSADAFDEQVSGAVAELSHAMTGIAEALRGDSRFSVADILRETAFADPEGPHRERGIADALFALSDGLTRALRDLGNGNAATPMGAIEAHGLAVKEAADNIASALEGIAEELAHAR